MPLTRLETSLCSKTATGMSRSGETLKRKKKQKKLVIKHKCKYRYNYNFVIKNNSYCDAFSTHSWILFVTSIWRRGRSNGMKYEQHFSLWQQLDDAQERDMAANPFLPFLMMLEMTTNHFHPFSSSWESLYFANIYLPCWGSICWLLAVVNILCKKLCFVLIECENIKCCFD